MGSMEVEEWRVHIFKCFSDSAYKCKTMEEERVELFPLERLSNLKKIDNLNWLIPMVFNDVISVEVFYHRSTRKPITFRLWDEWWLLEKKVVE